MLAAIMILSYIYSPTELTDTVDVEVGVGEVFLTHRRQVWQFITFVRLGDLGSKVGKHLRNDPDGAIPDPSSELDGALSGG